MGRPRLATLLVLDFGRVMCLACRRGGPSLWPAWRSGVAMCRQRPLGRAARPREMPSPGLRCQEMPVRLQSAHWQKSGAAQVPAGPGGPAFLFSWVPGVHTGPVPAHSESESESGGSSSSGGSRLGFLFGASATRGLGWGLPGPVPPPTSASGPIQIIQ